MEKQETELYFNGGGHVTRFHKEEKINGLDTPLISPLPLLLLLNIAFNSNCTAH